MKNIELACRRTMRVRSPISDLVKFEKNTLKSHHRVKMTVNTHFSNPIVKYKAFLKMSREKKVDPRVYRLFCPRHPSYSLIENGVDESPIEITTIEDKIEHCLIHIETKVNPKTWLQYIVFIDIQH